MEKNKTRENEENPLQCSHELKCQCISQYAILAVYDSWDAANTFWTPYFGATLMHAIVGWHLLLQNCVFL